jgi:transcriptional regulator with XRE-family HTH domain
VSDLRDNLRAEFQEPEYRYGYAESFLNTKLATQIKTLREQRGKTQAEAAALMGIKQPGYRRFEDINHSVWKTDTLWNIARAYGVRLDISFKTFGSLLDDKETFSKERLKVPEFEDDPLLNESSLERESAEISVQVHIPEPPLPAQGGNLGLPLQHLGGTDLASLADFMSDSPRHLSYDPNFGLGAPPKADFPSQPRSPPQAAATKTEQGALPPPAGTPSKIIPIDTKVTPTWMTKKKPNQQSRLPGRLVNF